MSPVFRQLADHCHHQRAFVGFGFAGVITTMDLIAARVMDEDTEKYNLRREGFISSALGFMNRLSGCSPAQPLPDLYLLWLRKRR